MPTVLNLHPGQSLPPTVAVGLSAPKIRLQSALIVALVWVLTAIASKTAMAGNSPAGYASPFLSAKLAPTTPAFAGFAVDSLGRGQSLDNVILEKNLPAGSNVLREAGNRVFRYTRRLAAGTEAEIWRVSFTSNSITLHSQYVPGIAVPPFLLLIDQKKNHATVLGRLLSGELKVGTPCVLHLPDHGTFRITASVTNAAIEYDARRRQPENFVRLAFPPADRQQGAVDYSMQVTLIYPPWPGLAENPRYDGFRRDFLNLIQLQPRLQTLANNSSSDACGFCFWEYAELARLAPPLAAGLTVNDLVRVSLDRVLAGGLTYGQVGYRGTPQFPEAAAWSPKVDSLDLLPSLLIAAGRYVESSGDRAWGEKQFSQLAGLGRQMLAEDHDGNGLIEYSLSGNAGSWQPGERPANWWDTIGFGHEDAYANALAYRACRLMSRLAAELGRPVEEKRFSAAADKIRAAYVPAFYNAQTGVLAGWKSADGKLHDYWFTFVNGLAISFGLVDQPRANAIMDRLLKKMNEVGCRRFEFGLPGNLIPIRREDYTDLRRRYGGPERADGSDAFQVYENGGATACHAYWMIKALYQLGRVADARRIFYPLLNSFSAGGFQGFGANGLSRDWRDWQGGCHGYEGYLSDGYLALLAVEDDLNAAQREAICKGPGLNSVGN
jgi:hypothetical protein